MEKQFTIKDTNIIKGAAILFLMFHHCFLSPARYKGMDVVFAPFTESQANYIAAFLKICVPIFVFLTAYGITVSLKKKSKKLEIDNQTCIQYTKNRYIKLFMGWLIPFLLCEVFCYIYNGQPLEVYGTGIKGIFYFIIDGLGIANLLGTPTLVGTWWYMSLAFTLILVMPVLIKIYSKIGFGYMMILVSFLSRQLSLTDSSLVHWLPVTLMGIWFADKNLLVKIKDFKITQKVWASKIIKFVSYTIILLAMVVFRQSGLSSYVFEIKDGVIPVFMIIYLYEFVQPIKIVNSILAFIGKYSMNIFLIHTVIRANCFRTFTYSFKYSLLIVAVLLIISLIIAVIIEKIKELTKYDKLISKIQSRYS